MSQGLSLGHVPLRRSEGERDRRGGLAVVLRFVVQQAADRAPIARPAFCTQEGGNGSRTSSKWASAITASRSGFGIPFRFVLPSAASSNMVSSSRSNWSAGLTSQTKVASVSPAFQNLCEIPAG